MLAHYGPGRVVVRAAGPAPARWSTPPTWPAPDVVLTMGCDDACPVYPARHYPGRELDNPAGPGLDTVRPIRDEIGRRVRALLAELSVK